MTDKLKPCPFCGSEDLEDRRGFIKCNSCGVEGPVFAIGGKHDDVRKEAIAAWNKRQGENDED